MRLLWDEEAWEDYISWQFEDKRTLRRLNNILKDIQRGVRDGIGKPEPLRGDFSGWFSRRIDKYNRIVYKYIDDVAVIASCKGHYD